MSEVRYRGLLRQVLTVQDNADILNFLGGLLTSTMPVPEQLRNVLEGNYEEIKPEAVYLVGILQIHMLVPTLIRLYNTALDNSSLQNQILEVIALRHLEHEERCQFLLARIQDRHLSTTLRMLAMSGIGRGKYPEAIGPLFAMIQDTTESSMFRCRAIEILRYKIKDVKSLMQVLLPLLKDDDLELRLVALQSIDVLGNASLASYVEPLLTDTTPAGIAPTIGEYARQILAKWGTEDNQDSSL